MNSQNKTTKIVFHFGVINNFNAKNMLKIYSLKNKINNLTEFNFYYLKEAMKKMKNFHAKGEACPGKFELPQLLPDDVDKILLFDAGDVIIFKDLTELYNYDMRNFWVLGLPEPVGIELIKQYNSTKY
jgi:lipopolysaccharide biosynthesis glycosyltransferase